MGKAAAKKLREAMKGMGTNEKKIIAVTNSFSHAQRMQIKQTFHQEFNRDLIKDLKKELSGKFEKMCVGFWLDAGRFDAELVKDAVDGIGFSTKILNEVICTRTNAQIEAMKAAWNGKFKSSMIDRIKSETNKLMSSGNYTNLLVTLLECGRAPNGPVDADGAKADAEVLNRFLSGKKD